MTTEKGTECVHFWFKQYFIHNLLHVILYNTVTYIENFFIFIECTSGYNYLNISYSHIILSL